jgi:hypothetical protein
MKMKLSIRHKSLSVFSIVTALVMLGTTVALAAGLLNLPATPITVVHGPWNAGTLGSTLDITLSNVPAGFDVTNGTYAGWCIEDNHQNNAPGTAVTIYEPSGGFWGSINWLINNRGGYGAWDVQVAIWMLTGTNTAFVTPGAQMLYNLAVANSGFVPGPGQLVAVRIIDDNAVANMYQDTIIEVRIPYTPPGGEGCTPGYWRNHPEDWAATGYAWGDDFDTVFGVDKFNPDITLGQAIWLGGGGVKALARHGTAALLSAAHPDVNYPYSVDEVKAMVQAGNWAPLATANELGCSIP